MLSPDYLKTVTDDLENYFYDLETKILCDIAERIRLNSNHMTSTADWQYRQIKELGTSNERINEYLADALNTSTKEASKIISKSAYKAVESDNAIFEEAFRKGLIDNFSYDKSSLKDIIAEGVTLSSNDLRNICNSTAIASQNKLLQYLNSAYIQIQSGAFSSDQVVDNVVTQLSKDGLAWIDYSSGAHRRVDSAVRQALRTSVNRTALKCQEANCDELGCNLVEVTSHFGARPDHAEWQGKIYWIKEPYKNYRNFQEATGYGKVDGLGGVNCRHSFYPFFEGLSTKSFEHYNEAENEEFYNLQQQQRYNERKIREWKRKQKIKDSAGLDSTKEKAKVREWTSRNKALINSNDKLKRNYGREKGYLKTAKERKGQWIAKDEFYPYYLKEKENHIFGGKALIKNEKIQKDSIVFVNNENVEFVYPKVYDKIKQIISPRTAIVEFEKLPKKLQESVKTIEFLDIFNPRDDYWGKKYNIENFVSFATGGNDKITFWQNGDLINENINAIVFRTYCHEAAHIIDSKGIISSSDIWISAINKDNGVVTEYARASFREDFAESVAEYVTNKEKFKKEFPNRFEVIEEILE